MTISINKLYLSLTAFAITVTFVVFGAYYLEQRNRTGILILESLKDDLSELRYNLSRSMNANESLLASRILIDRAISRGDFIDTILLVRGSEILVSTDPFVSQLPPEPTLRFSADINDDFTILKAPNNVQGTVRYFSGAQPQVLDLVFLLDHEDIMQYRNLTQGSNIWYMCAILASLLLFISMVSRYLVVRPLRLLRKLACYQNGVPERFMVGELEAIRYRLKDTFHRLDVEQEALFVGARRDNLSGLANRHALQEHIISLISECSRSGEEFAFLFMDFDKFKYINDSLGHEVGDEVIQEASKLLAASVRRQDLVARVGGDEFAIVIRSYASKDELSQIIQRMQSSLRNTPFAGEHRLHIGSSVGIAIFPHDGADYLTLMKNSDIAMFEAKRQSNCSYQYFSAEFHERTREQEEPGFAAD